MLDLNSMAHVTPAQIQKYLAGMQYPATKEDLIKHARTKNAPEEAINMLEELPDGESFENPTQVTETLEDLSIDDPEEGGEEEKEGEENMD